MLGSLEHLHTALVLGQFIILGFHISQLQRSHLYIIMQRSNQGPYFLHHMVNMVMKLMEQRSTRTPMFTQIHLTLTTLNRQML